ncbi:DUF2971 domain-containing protein [Rhizobium sp. TH2]|uniref:DUF2971 domain-containing protein n=1 Tax=Rhizobium sp. TH2 TaxID=2775403 RepID=UPI0021570D7C|nr:DUF2971 domain-containing protein [Rhizobium sp. TH2]UVC09129.1 DUF2971 domain-containing protein [Rhizobium sp. TH2]
MMNDYNETGYGYSVFEEAANEMLKDEDMKRSFPDFDTSVLDKIDEALGSNQFMLHPTIACFSKKPDVLSQWRGYADDARGFAVGFSAHVLKKLPVSLLEVEYVRETQVKEMKVAIGATYLKNLESDDPYGRDFRDDCLLLANWMFAFKSEAFAEEQEVRCLHALTVDIKEDSWTLSSVMDTDDGSKPGPDVKFRTNADGGLTAYMDMPIPNEDGQTIKEIWLGPKNSNGPGNVRYLLGNNGFTNVSFFRSRATYR